MTTVGTDMTLARVHSAVVDGATGVSVLVEADVAQGLPSVGMVGLAGATVAESRWRVRSAIGNSRLPWPSGRITIGLSPADLPKVGTGLDLAIAVALLETVGHVPPSAASWAYIGELGLDGEVKPAAGVLPAALAAHASGRRTLIVSVRDAALVRLLPDVAVWGISDLRELVDVLRGDAPPPAPVALAQARDVDDVIGDLAEVRGHETVRFGLEVAAAGRHHCALVGPPGIGKSMLAMRMATVLPDLDDREALEVTALQSLAGTIIEGRRIRRPVQISPHHTASAAALLGTARGTRVIPGAVTLAHRGVLVMDEAPEFARPCLEGLRQPLEQGSIAIHRVGRAAILPARFQLVLTANPCPCGQAIGVGADCSCSPMAKRRYAERLSGPLMDRVDVRLTTARPSVSELLAADGETSEEVRGRVVAARARAAARFAAEPFAVNGEIPGAALRRQWAPEPRAVDLLEASHRNGGSMRGIDRVLRMSWTVADLRGAVRPTADDVVVAMGLRGDGGLA